jgi:hypothetical protein
MAAAPATASVLLVRNSRRLRQSWQDMRAVVRR